MAVLMEKKMVVLFLLVAMIGLQEAKGAFYKVGDSAGWTNIGNVDYKTWASSKNFKVGDSIVFEYNNQFHNVVRVTHKNFNACNATGGYQSYVSGNDTFVIRKKGHYYFICSLAGHCESGQKVDIRVPGDSPVVAPPPTTPPTAAPTPPPGVSAPAPSPKSNDSTSLIYSSSKDLILLLSALSAAIFGVVW